MGLFWAKSAGYTFGGALYAGPSTDELGAHRILGVIISIVGARTGDMTTIYGSIFDMVAGLTYIGGR